MPAPIGAPTITFTVTAVIRREWTIVLPTSLVDQAAQALRKEARLSPYRRVHASCILDQIRTDGGEFAAGIPDPDEWDEMGVEPFTVANSMLLQIEEAWHENNDD